MVGIELQHFLENCFKDFPIRKIVCIDQVPRHLKVSSFQNVLLVPFFLTGNGASMVPLQHISRRHFEMILPLKKPEFLIVNTAKSSDTRGRHWFVVNREKIKIDRCKMISFFELGQKQMLRKAVAKTFTTAC